MIDTIVECLEDPLVQFQHYRASHGGTNNDTDLLRRLEDLVQGSEVWEIARHYRIHRYRHSDAEYQTVEVEVMRNRDIGWRIIATDTARDISASGPRTRT